MANGRRLPSGSSKRPARIARSSAPSIAMAVCSVLTTKTPAKKPSAPDASFAAIARPAPGAVAPSVSGAPTKSDGSASPPAAFGASCNSPSPAPLPPLSGAPTAISATAPGSAFGNDSTWPNPNSAQHCPRAGRHRSHPPLPRTGPRHTSSLICMSPFLRPTARSPPSNIRCGPSSSRPILRSFSIFSDPTPGGPLSMTPAWPLKTQKAPSAPSAARRRRLANHPTSPPTDTEFSAHPAASGRRQKFPNSQQRKLSSSRLRTFA